MDLLINNDKACWGDKTFNCSIGANGLTNSKIEGDKKTPIGRFVFRQVYYREDRIQSIKTALPISAITTVCGWCDDPKSPDYNRYIKKPFSYSHEDLWMERSLYDLILVIGHNDSPPMPGNGSAVFIHIAPENYGPTAGCIGLDKNDLLKIISQADVTSHVIIGEVKKCNSPRVRPPLR